MPHVLVRDLDPVALERLKERARQHGRSLQSELKSILEGVAQRPTSKAKTLAAGLRKRLAGRTHSDSAMLIDEDRKR